MSREHDEYKDGGRDERRDRDERNEDSGRDERRDSDGRNEDGGRDERRDSDERNGGGGRDECRDSDGPNEDGGRDERRDSDERNGGGGRDECRDSDGRDEDGGREKRRDRDGRNEGGGRDDRGDSAARHPVDIERREWRKMERRRKRQQWLTVASPLLLLALWEALSRSHAIDPRFFPPPTGILRTFWTLAAGGELLPHVGVSLVRIVLGFLAGTIPGVLLGLWMGMYRPLRAFFSPLLMALMPIPTLALMPLIMIVFGIGEGSKIVTIAGSVFFPVVINTAVGVAGIDKAYVDVAQNYGASPKDFVLRIALPGALPVMMEGVQMGQAIALLTIVAAEMIGANTGIGYLIWSSYKVFDFHPMYVGLLLISFFGYLFSILLRWLQQRLIPWQ